MNSPTPELWLGPPLRRTSEPETTPQLGDQVIAPPFQPSGRRPALSTPPQDVERNQEPLAELESLRRRHEKAQRTIDELQALCFSLPNSYQPRDDGPSDEWHKYHEACDDNTITRAVLEAVADIIKDGTTAANRGEFSQLQTFVSCAEEFLLVAEGFIKDIEGVVLKLALEKN